MLKNLKSLFVVTDEDEPTDGNSVEGEAAFAQNQRQSAPPSPSPADAPGPTVNPSIVNKLLDAIDDNDLEGFDYLEYKRALKAMESLPMDEATRFRSAFATAATVGASLEKLLGSVTHYVEVLDRQRGDFEGVVQRELDGKVAGREAELDTLRREIDAKLAQVSKLQAEIEADRKRSDELAAAVAESRSKILGVKAQFAASFNYVKTLFEQDADKMRRYLE